MAELVRVPRPDYVQCVKCHMLIRKSKIGPLMHANQYHPRVEQLDTLYRAAPDRLVPTEDLPQPPAALEHFRPVP
jgi:hypothetical protein